MAEMTPDLAGALERVRRYCQVRAERPMRQISADEIHAVHTGTEWEASLFLADIRTLLARCDKTAALEVERDAAAADAEMWRKVTLLTTEGAQAVVEERNRYRAQFALVDRHMEEMKASLKGLQGHLTESERQFQGMVAEATRELDARQKAERERDAAVEALAETGRALAEHNDLLRSAFQAAQRDATADVAGTTNYRLAADAISRVLDRHHAAVTRARDALAAGPSFWKRSLDETLDAALTTEGILPPKGEGA